MMVFSDGAESRGGLRTISISPIQTVERDVSKYGERQLPSQKKNKRTIDKIE